MPEQTIADKEILFREGEPGDCAYVLLSGSIEILKRGGHGDVQLAVLEPGDVFGEMALLDPGGLRSASARAVGETSVDTLSAEEFFSLIDQCPLTLRPFLDSLIGRLKTTNQRIADRERATVLLDQAINHIRIEGVGALAGLIEPFVIDVPNLPFSIGGYSDGSDLAGQNLDIICYEQPPFVSRLHCQIERQAQGIFLTDQGSRFGTIVNSISIGRGKPAFKALLLVGENHVQMGGVSSPYRLLLTCS